MRNGKWNQSSCNWWSRVASSDLCNTKKRLLSMGDGHLHNGQPGTTTRTKLFAFHLPICCILICLLRLKVTFGRGFIFVLVHPWTRAVFSRRPSIFGGIKPFTGCRTTLFVASTIKRMTRAGAFGNLLPRPRPGTCPSLHKGIHPGYSHINNKTRYPIREGKKNSLPLP